MEPQRPPLKVGGYDLVAIALFAIAGAIIGLAIAIIYIGVNLLNAIDSHWFVVLEGQ